MYTKFEEQLKEQAAMKKKITEIENKLEQLEIRFIEGEISKELFDKYTQSYKKEREQLEREMANNDFESSNIDKAITKGVELLLKPLVLWEDSDYDDKQRLQYLLFPEGILYNKQKREVRTRRTNTILSLIADVARLTEDDTKKATSKSGLNSHWVAGTGIEPVFAP